LGFEKSQRSVTHDFLRYINIFTYLLTYLLKSSVLIDRLEVDKLVKTTD